jgi:hypothetical protein
LIPRELDQAGKGGEDEIGKWYISKKMATSDSGLAKNHHQARKPAPVSLSVAWQS